MTMLDILWQIYVLQLSCHGEDALSDNVYVPDMYNLVCGGLKISNLINNQMIQITKYSNDCPQRTARTLT